MAKRIIIGCDGTWSTPADVVPTNVRRFTNAILPQAQDGTVQWVYCQNGVGTNWYDKWPGGAFGAGIDEKIQEAYRLLCEQYQVGDEVYLLGYSRGAYTARSLGGLVSLVGLLRPDQTNKIDNAYRIYRIQNEAKRRSAGVAFQQRYATQTMPITLLGCWDTVGSLGIPDLIPNLPFDYFVNQPLRFHNTVLSQLVQHALQVASVDEQHKIYGLTPMEVPNGSPTQLRQVWFPGDHGQMGKGPLADVTLAWMIQAIGEAGLGLEFDAAKVNQLRPDPLAGAIPDLFTTKEKGFSLLTATGLKVRQIPATPTPEHQAQLFHPSVSERWCKDPTYRPRCLVEQGWQSLFDAGC